MSPRQKLLMINQPWLKEELTSLGNDVLTAGVGEERGLDFLIPDNGVNLEDLLAKLPVKPDRIVVFDDSSTLKIFGFERNTIPSIFYSVDAHHHSRWHRYLSSLFDLTLVAQKQHIPEFETQSDNVKWFPLWPLRIPEPVGERESIVSFRGNLRPDLHPERAGFFDQLQKIIPLDASLGDWAEPYSKALIVINQTVCGDLNFRNFEAIAAGALLVTPRLNNGFNTLFDEGKDYVAYQEGNVEEAAQVLKHYLERKEEAIEIAKRGREKLLKGHTSQMRAIELSDLLGGLTLREKKSIYSAALLSILPTLLSYRYHEQNKNWERYFDESLRLLRLAIESEELLTEDYISAGVFMVLLMLAECSRFGELEEISKKLLERNKIDQIINVVFVVHALINQQKEQEAIEFGKEYSTNAGEFIHSIPGLLGQVRESVLSSLNLK